MCGIAGFVSSDKDAGVLREQIQRMTATLIHRGPDDQGEFIDPQSGVGLGHRRLAIFDLSSNGRQPMASLCGRYKIVYNGEIYNFRELRAELESSGAKFRSESDTEVLLAAFSRWGIAASVKRVNGMFAFAVWDAKERKLILARDRMGEKPLYYGLLGRTFIFGSELKALKTCRDFKFEIDRDALALYLKHNYIPAPHSIYHGIHKLPPGCMLVLSTENPERMSISSYWSLEEAVHKGLEDPFRGSSEEAQEELRRLLKDSVRLRMLADVEVGIFLSGGIDSSLVTALACEERRDPVRTFSIGFREGRYNEAAVAKKISDRLGTQHSEFFVTDQNALSLIPQLPSLFDEPFSDNSQIPTFLLAKLAREDVKVCLSGDGGDELFGGYGRYFWAENLWNGIRWIPQPLRQMLAGAVKKIPSGDRLHKLAEVLPLKNRLDLYCGINSQWRGTESIVIGGGVLNGDANGHKIRFRDFIHEMMYVDSTRYLPGDILTKVDRAAMAVSLESRMPYLDSRVVEFAWRLPLAYKVREGQGKWILRQILKKYLSADLIRTQKKGFGIPLAEWLRGPLRDWAEGLLSEGRIQREGFLNPQIVKTKWQEHLSGKRNWHYELFSVLMFQSWLDHAR